MVEKKTDEIEALILGIPMSETRKGQVNFDREYIENGSLDCIMIRYSSIAFSFSVALVDH